MLNPVAWREVLDKARPLRAGLIAKAQRSSSTEVTMEIPASKSEPNSRRASFCKSSQTKGVPPSASTTKSGRLVGSAAA